MLKNLVIHNRSYRSYDENRRVTREELLEFVDLTRFTASGINRQALKYRIVCEKEAADALQALTKWGAMLPQLQLPPPGKCPTGFIVICRDAAIAPHPNSCLTDIGIAAQTILLAAVEKGLGGCMIGNFRPEAVQAQLGLGKDMCPQLIVAIGKPAEEIRLTAVGADGNTAYYRDENGTHCVPKRSLEDILL